jgi:uncharacterized phiE125 gp8 family phage protein
MALDTLANVKTDLMVASVTDDDLLTRLMAAAESFIEQYTGRAFAGGTFTELHPGGRPLLFLRNYPVDAITTLRVDPNRQFGSETARDATTFVVHADRGVIESLTGPFLPPARSSGPPSWPEAVKVTYTTPTGQVPAAVTNAFSQLVAHWYRQAKTATDQEYLLLIERIDTGGTKGYPWDLALGLKLPPGVLQLLHPFRVVPV